MLTRSEKLKRKRGRPLKQAARTDTGQLSRAKDPGPPPDLVARLKRMELFGLAYEQTNQPHAATFIGRLCLMGAEKGISQEQYNAIDRLIIEKSRYRMAIDAPDSLRNSTGGPSSVFDEEEQSKRFRALETRYKGAMQTLIQLQHSLPKEHITMAREQCIFTDHDLPELIGAIRLIGNALQRYWERAR